MKGRMIVRGQIFKVLTGLKNRTDFWNLWEKVRVGCLARTASKHVYYLG